MLLVNENTEGVAICDFYDFAFVNRIGKQSQRNEKEYQEQGGAHSRIIALKRSPSSGFPERGLYLGQRLPDDSRYGDALPNDWEVVGRLCSHLL